MLIIRTALWGAFLGLFLAPTLGAKESMDPSPLPGELNPGDLVEFDSLDPDRKKLLEHALRLGREHRLNQYIYGSADPDRGGFDCSGSIYYILSEMDLKPARSSSAQYEWLKKSGSIIEVPKTAKSLEDPAFEKLMPGDLLFWAGTYQPTEARPNKITHVQMFLGTEKASGKPVMIGSSDGRSYQGKARCGFGVFDFRLPRAGSKSRFVGFGTPPGIKS